MKKTSKVGYDSPLRGKYLVRNPFANALLCLMDALLSLLRVRAKQHFEIRCPKRILLSNIAQLGDVIMMTALLPVLKKALPDIEIGVLVGSWAERIVREHPMIQSVHLVDHWKISRLTLGRVTKVRKYLSMHRKALEEIKERQYDAVVECCYYFPNTIWLTYRANIPVRIGYVSGGLGPLLTHPMKWTNQLQSIAHYFADLVSLIAPLDRTLLRPTLPSSSVLLPFPSKSYLVMHMGSGNSAKEWPIESWRELTRRLVEKKKRLLFTGMGAKEHEAILRVIEGMPHCMNLCNQLSWVEFVEVIREAEGLIGIDTSAGHVAAATDTPSVIIFNGLNPIQQWRPISSKARILMHPMPCYPCYLKKGCNAIDCVRKISVDDVYGEILESF